MAILQIKTNEDSAINIIVRESDPYSESVFLKFERHYDVNSHRISEMFMTPSQMDLLGRFLIREAAEIKLIQADREMRNKEIKEAEFLTSNFLKK